VRPRAATGLGIVMSALFGCQAVNHTPLGTVDYVDLERFMGDWYVIASIPTFLEKDAFNAVESYRLTERGHVATTFTFRQGSFDGPVKRYTPTGFVSDTKSNAVWGMQFLWPFKADYRVIHLNADYSVTVIGRSRRDYVWIMARTPTIPEADYRAIVRMVASRGYDTATLRKVPQSWPASGP